MVRAEALREGSEDGSAAAISGAVPTARLARALELTREVERLLSASTDDPSGPSSQRQPLRFAQAFARNLLDQLEEIARRPPS